MALTSFQGNALSQVNNQSTCKSPGEINRAGNVVVCGYCYTYRSLGNGAIPPFLYEKECMPPASQQNTFALFPGAICEQQVSNFQYLANSGTDLNPSYSKRYIQSKTGCEFVVPQNSIYSNRLRPSQANYYYY